MASSILVVCGSRNRTGQTARAAQALLDGVAGLDCTVDRLFLPELNIQRCRQCQDDGWGWCKEKGTCIVDDDFSTVVDKIQSAGAVVFATPVYFGDISESLRALLDRLRRTCMNQARRARIEGKAALGLCVAGGGGGGGPECCASLAKTLIRSGFDVVDTLPVRRQNLESKLAALRQTGAWIARLVRTEDPPEPTR